MNQGRPPPDARKTGYIEELTCKMEISENILAEGSLSKRPLRRIRVSHPVPAPSIDEPTDDELLRFLDGAMTEQERLPFEERLKSSPYASARVEVLSAALAENGWPVSDDDPTSGSA